MAARVIRPTASRNDRARPVAPRITGSLHAPRAGRDGVRASEEHVRRLPHLVLMLDARRRRRFHHRCEEPEVRGGAEGPVPGSWARSMSRPNPISAPPDDGGGLVRTRAPR